MFPYWSIIKSSTVWQIMGAFEKCHCEISKHTLVINSECGWNSRSFIQSVTLSERSEHTLGTPADRREQQSMT